MTMTDDRVSLTLEHFKGLDSQRKGCETHQETRQGT